MLILRFARVGKNKKAFFHLVVAEKARAVQKKIVEKLGYYNPHTEGGKGEFVFDKDRVLHFLKNGAQVSQTVARKLVKADIKDAGKFVKQRSTQPKKEKKETPTEGESTKETVPSEN